VAFEADHEPADAAREDFKHSAAARERKAFVAGATRIKKEPVADGEQAGLMAVAKNHDSSGRLQTPQQPIAPRGMHFAQKLGVRPFFQLGLRDGQGRIYPGRP